MKASNEMYVPLDHRIRFSVRCASRVTMSVYMYVTKSKHEQTNSWVFGTLGKPSKNPLNYFLMVQETKDLFLSLKKSKLLTKRI